MLNRLASAISRRRQFFCGMVVGALAMVGFAPWLYAQRMTATLSEVTWDARKLNGAEASYLQHNGACTTDLQLLGAPYPKFHLEKIPTGWKIRLHAEGEHWNFMLEEEGEGNPKIVYSEDGLIRTGVLSSAKPSPQGSGDSRGEVAGGYF
jgi:hypothetical protein